MNRSIALPEITVPPEYQEGDDIIIPLWQIQTGGPMPTKILCEAMRGAAAKAGYEYWEVRDCPVSGDWHFKFWRMPPDHWFTQGGGHAKNIIKATP